MKNFDGKKKVLLFVLLGVFLLIGTSYAIWQLNFTQESSNTLSVACFSVTYSEQDNISLLNTYPMLDSEGSTLTPYQVTIKNNCNEYGAYQVNLEVLNTTTLDSGKVKIMFDEGTPKLLTSYTVVEKTLSNASSAYKMTTGFLQPNEERTYTLRLWVDENVTLEDHVEGKRFASKITISNTYKPGPPSPQEECESLYGEGATICNIIGQAEPENDKCLKVDENGMIIDPYSTMSDEETPIICTMEDDYGTSYYFRGLHTDNNVKFANMCWKLIRITGTGGMKLIYNGDLDANGKCTTNSGSHSGFTGTAMTLAGNRVYGTSYIKEGDTYTLTGTSTMNWPNDSSSIIGKYSCLNANTSCTTLYAVTGDYGLSQGYGYGLTLDRSKNYAWIGTIPFNNYFGSQNNTKSASPALVGYMYNDIYPNKSKSLSSNKNNYYYGESFTYNNGTYTLNNTIQFADVTISGNRTSLNTHHYTCFNATDATCTELYYIYYLIGTGTTVFYIQLNENETGPQALNKMVGNNDINVKNSTIKGAIDWWYEHNIKNTPYENYLEDTIFCNDRTIDSLGGWSDTGNLGEGLIFNVTHSLKCPNKRDAFTVSDSNKGNSALTYPVGLLTIAEHSLIGNLTANKTGLGNYWSLSPAYFYDKDAYGGTVSQFGRWSDTNSEELYRSYGARPAVSLLPGTNFKAGGDGTASNPYEVE